MKNILILFLFILISVPAVAQQDSVINFNTDTKVVLKVTRVDYNFDNRPMAELLVVKQIYQVYQASSGQYYVVYTVNNVETRRYLGWLTSYTYERMTVFCNSDKTKFYYLQIDAEGLPYRIELPDFLFT